MLRTDLKIISIIPARSGSKGLPNKNIKDLGGYPLLSWSVRASTKSKYINSTFIDTDSDKYAKIGISYGAQSLYLRPDYLATDTSSDYDFISYFLKHLKQNDATPDLLVHLRPTTPLRDPKVIDEAIELGIKNIDQITALRSVHEMAETAYKSFEFGKEERLVTTFSRSSDLDSSNASRQLFPKTFQANGYVDILFPNKILSMEKLHSNRVLGFKTLPIIEIDTDSEFQLCIASLSLNNISFDRIWS
jgi:CMP-N-acetylneuraminic acid synthetase